MVGFESESKFIIKKNPGAVQSQIMEWIATGGYNVSESRIVDQVDVYLDKNMILYKAGFSLRHRFVGSSLKKITLKTLEHFGKDGLVRIEEEADSYPELVKKVVNKLRSIYQDPADEMVLGMLSETSGLEPKVILSTRREKAYVRTGSQSCELSFDTVIYLFPTITLPVREIEIEGSEEFDKIRKYISDTFAHGRWPSIERSEKSKFEHGLEIGGMI